MFRKFFARRFSRLDRSAVRFAVERNLDCDSRSVQARDVSAGGVRIMAPFKLRQGQTVTVSANPDYQVRCRVVWQKIQGEHYDIGLAYDDAYEARGRFLNHLL